MKCGLIKCLINDQNGECTLDLKHMVNRATADSEKCRYYSDDFKKDLMEFKLNGGVNGALKTNNKADKSVDIESAIPKSTSKEGVKVTYDYNGYTINRLNDRSYEIIKDGKKQQAKHLFIDFICELDKKCDKKILLKKGTRPLGNTFLRLVGINL
jgi:hypothetical protein